MCSVHTADFHFFQKTLIFYFFFNNNKNFINFKFIDKQAVDVADKS